MRYLFVLLALAGCSATNWTKEGATQAELDADYRACNKAANEGGPGAAALFGAIGVAARSSETNEKIRACMRQKGWQSTAPAAIATGNDVVQGAERASTRR